MDRCGWCGFEYDLAAARTAARSVLDNSSRLATILTGDADLRSRRQAGMWSPLEYGCHVRDVLLVQRERVLTARRVELPSFEPMGRDERVDHDGYAEQEPALVARQLGDAALLFANVLARLAATDWDRRVVYNYPQRAERSLRWVAVHTVHEVRHHLLDIERQLP
jgi:DinB superfamily